MKAGLKDIIDYRPRPVGLLATSYLNPLTGNDTYPVCAHGGWYECELQAYQLCLFSENKDPWLLKKLVACHLAGFAKNELNLTADCAARLQLDHAKLERCARSDDSVDLLRKSFLLGVGRGVIATPSIYINGNYTLDWYTDFVGEVCAAYTGPKPAACTARGEMTRNATSVEPVFIRSGCAVYPH